MTNIVQRTPEWFAVRAGKVTASRINDVMATLKSGGEAATRKNYRAQLVCERLTGAVQESFTNAAMQWGTDNEPHARSAYEFIYDRKVDEVGFIDHHTIKMAGASPDGLIGDGLVEIKCPNTATHIEWMLAGVVPSEHQNQMLWQMDCANGMFCDFVSYDPRLPPDLQLFVIRFDRDQKRIEELRAAVEVFNSEVEMTVTRLHNLTQDRKAA